VIDSLKTENEEFKGVIRATLKSYRSVITSILNADVSIEYWNSEKGEDSSPFLPPVGSLGPFEGQSRNHDSPPFLSPSLTDVSTSASTSSNNMANNVTNKINDVTNPVTNNQTNQLLHELQTHSVLITTELSDMKEKYIIQSESYESLKMSHVILEASREVGKKSKKSLEKIYKKISNFLELYAKDLYIEEMFSPRTEGIERSIMSSPPSLLGDTEVGEGMVKDIYIYIYICICIYIYIYMYIYKYV
jgi:hypothetical protein